MKESRQRALGRRTFGAVAAGVGLAMALSACGGSSNPLSSAPASSGAASGSGGALVIGSADFPLVSRAAIADPFSTASRRI